MSAMIECAEHGSSNASFVCTHVRQSLIDNVARGFCYSSLDPDVEPCAWCDHCDQMLTNGGGDWNEELEAVAKIKLLCSSCFMKAARLNGVAT